MSTRAAKPLELALPPTPSASVCVSCSQARGSECSRVDINLWGIRTRPLVASGKQFPMKNSPCTRSAGASRSEAPHSPPVTCSYTLPLFSLVSRGLGFYACPHSLVQVLTPHVLAGLMMLCLLLVQTIGRVFRPLHPCLTVLLQVGQGHASHHPEEEMRPERRSVISQGQATRKWDSWTTACRKDTYLSLCNDITVGFFLVIKVIHAHHREFGIAETY